MLQQGGMNNMQALQTATINPARSLGFDKWIGSLEPGNLQTSWSWIKIPWMIYAIRKSIRYTMVNGRLYDAEQMNETGNYNKPRPKFFWETW
jgi:cytosine/adenosine deaminase-related metal-dependent hydrolase